MSEKPTIYSGCAILVPRALWEKLGGFDEDFALAYCEDSDLALRIRAAGGKVYYCPVLLDDRAFEGIKSR